MMKHRDTVTLAREFLERHAEKNKMLKEFMSSKPSSLPTIQASTSSPLRTKNRRRRKKRKHETRLPRVAQMKTSYSTRLPRVAQMKTSYSSEREKERAILLKERKRVAKSIEMRRQRKVYGKTSKRKRKTGR